MTNSGESELIEVWDWHTARPTGESVRREVSHKEGIPHEGVHLWIIKKEINSVYVLFQHRAPHKKMHPDCLDITVGGHVPFGLRENKIQKEAMEEIGITLEKDSLIDLGYFRYEERDRGLYHREFQRVYLLLDNRPLEEYFFNDGEVVGIYAVPLAFLKILMNRDMEIEVEGYNGTDVIVKKVSRKDFHPLLFSVVMNDYMLVLFEAVEELLKTNTVTVQMSI